MSAKPYVVQQDSPNLVIVPTETCYEQPLKEVKSLNCDVSLQNFPTPIQNVHSALTKKTANHNFSTRSVNNDVLIDVTKLKKSPSSWASNFLQSIGGPSVKFPRGYSSPPKLSLIHKESIQRESNKGASVSNTTTNTHQRDTNTTTIQPVMEKEKCLPKINLNLIKRKVNEPANQSVKPTLTKETSQSHNIKVTQTKTCPSLSQVQIHKEPALPKGYKIPIQLKCNKPIQSTVDTKSTHLNSSTLTHQSKNNTATTVPVNTMHKSSNDSVQLKYNKPVSQDARANHEINQPEKKNDIYYEKLNKAKSSQESNYTRVSRETNEQRNVKDKHQLKSGNVLPQSINKKIISKSKYDEHTQYKSNKYTDQPKKYEDINQLKSGKEGKRTDLRRNKDTSPTKNSKDIISHKSNKENNRSTYIKEALNQKEITHSTKLKTKKSHEISNNSNIINDTKPQYSSDRITKKYKYKTNKESDPSCEETSSESVQIKKIKLSKAILKKEELILKLQRKKKAIEKKIKAAGLDNDKMNKNKRTESKQTTKDINSSKSFVEVRSSKSISPIKSVVNKIRSDNKKRNSDKHYKNKSDYNSCFQKSPVQDFGYNFDNCDAENKAHKNSDIDLRNKLKRKMDENDNGEDSKLEHSSSNKKNKFATIPNGDKFVANENLIISFNAEDTNEETDAQKKPPVKKMARKRPPGGKKCKKIKLEINIVFGNADTDTADEELMESEDEPHNETTETTDLSFLDDFNVDEIAESLNECKKSNNEQVQNTEPERYLILRNNETKNETIPYQDISPAIIKIRSQEEIEEKMSFNENRSIHNIPDTYLCAENVTETADIHCLPIIENIIVKKEDVNKNLDSEENTESQRIENFKLQIETFIIPEPKICSEPVDAKKKELHINQTIDVEHNITMSQNEKLIIESRTGSNETRIEKDSSENITVQNQDVLMYSQCVIMNDHTVVSNSNKQDMLLKQNSVHSDMHVTIKEFPQKAETVDTNPINTTGSTKIDTVIDKQTNIESNVITIDDSDGENYTETKKNQLNDDVSLKTLCGQEISKNMTSVESISDNSDSTLVLDTDYSIDKESSDNTTIQLNVNDQNEDEVNSILAKSNENITEDVKTTDYEVKQNIVIKEDTCNKNKAIKTVETIGINENLHTDNKKKTTSNIQAGCGNTSFNYSKDATSEIKPEIKTNTDKTEEKDSKYEKGDLSNAANARVEDLTTSKEAPKTKRVEKPSVTSENNLSNSGPTNYEAQNKDNGSNSENKNKVVKSSEAMVRADVSPDLLDDKFVQKLETKLFSFMGQKYLVTELIHVGRFSKIYTCKDRLLCDFTIKVIKNEEDHIPLGRHKQNMLTRLQNGVPENNLNCVRLLRGFSVCGLWCFIMEYYPRNLAEALEECDRGFHIDDVQNLSRQLVSAVTILRNNNIIHSDIKPSHILINATNTRLKLCGFDQASYIGYCQMLPNTGTVNYRAPELILGYPAGYGIDVWSTALVMFEMATNRKLFPGIYNNDILFKQLCTIGWVPMEMLMQSNYRSTHFKGTAFSRIVGAEGQRIVVNEIRGNYKLNGLLFRSYSKAWGKKKSLAEKLQDETKLGALLELLQSMLVMFPKYRIAIEFVFANPFIYETFDR